jgi:hypothetical protein
VINMLALRPAYIDSVGRTDRLLRWGSTGVRRIAAPHSLRTVRVNRNDVVLTARVRMVNQLVLALLPVVQLSPFNPISIASSTICFLGHAARPSDDSSGEHINPESGIHGSRPGGNIGEIRHPQPVRLSRRGADVSPAQEPKNRPYRTQ